MTERHLEIHGDKTSDSISVGWSDSEDAIAWFWNRAPGMDGLRNAQEYVRMREEIETLRHSRAAMEKAEAACAEMREIIHVASEYGIRSCSEVISKSLLNADQHSSECNLCHALSTSCGKGWLSPKRVKELDAKLEHQEDRVRDLSIAVDNCTLLAREYHKYSDGRHREWLDVLNQRPMFAEPPASIIAQMAAVLCHTTLDLLDHASKLALADADAAVVTAKCRDLEGQVKLLREALEKVKASIFHYGDKDSMLDNVYHLAQQALDSTKP